MCGVQSTGRQTVVAATSSQRRARAAGHAGQRVRLADIRRANFLLDARPAQGGETLERRGVGPRRHRQAEVAAALLAVGDRHPAPVHLRRRRLRRRPRHR